jgi:hypothetical protein
MGLQLNCLIGQHADYAWVCRQAVTLAPSCVVRLQAAHVLTFGCVRESVMFMRVCAVLRLRNVRVAVCCVVQGPLPLTTRWRWLPPPLTLTPRALTTPTRRRLWWRWLPAPQPQPSTQVG